MKKNVADVKKSASTTETEPHPEPQTATTPTSWQRLRENIEAVVVAIVLALIIRHYSLEAFEIPTGSMAPGLHGVHVDVSCPNCDTSDSLGIQTDSHTTALVVDWQNLPAYEGNCPTCGCRVEDLTREIGVPTYCPNCQEHRPSDPAGFRVPGNGFSPLTDWRRIPRSSWVLIGLALVVALSVKSKKLSTAAWIAVIVLGAHAMYGVYSSLTPKAAKIQNTCSECGFRYYAVFEPSDCLGGHKILVNKFLYQAREPRRWDVIVFKFNRQRNYIKRLVGLPGERIRVLDGDLWTAKGPTAPLTIERKPEWAQDQLWSSVHDSEIVERGYAKPSAWSPSAGWITRDDTTALQFNGLKDSVSLTYQRPITSSLAYNRVERSPHRVFDLRLCANLTVGGGDGSVELQVLNGDRTFRCVIPVAGGSGGEDQPPGISATDTANGRSTNTVLAPLPSEIRLERDRQYELDFYRADGFLVLRVDGVIVSEVEIPSSLRSNRGNDLNSVRWLGHRVGGTLHRVRVSRDIFYTSDDTGQLPNATVAEYSIPEDGFFAMGDNSSSSLDSRAWGHLSRGNLLGRAFAIFWPGLPNRWEIGFIR